ncbi:hypothetical protein ACVW00_000803 [Marmoricola sp. URHA0025 HA25]
MSDEPSSPDATRARARAEAKRRRRLAEIFGDVIPEQTGDDADEGGASDRRTEEKAQEDWLRSQVPPHHG